MSLIYDNDGNPIGEDIEFPPGPSPLSAYMGSNVDEFWNEPAPEPTRPARRFKDPEAEAVLPRFKTMTLKELANLPDPEWLVDGILPADSMTTVFGAPGSTKSFWALDVACCIASGSRFQGAEVRDGYVLYAVGEGLRGLKWRVEAWKLAHPDADHELLEERLIIIPHAVHLLEKPDQEMLVNTANEVAEVGDLRMFVLDTWARSLVGGDENSAQDVGIAIDVCDRIRTATGASPLLIHHTGAEGTRERGSTALRGASDASLQMTKDDTGNITLYCKKMKEAEPFAPQRYMLAPFGNSVVLQPAGLGLGSRNEPLSAYQQAKAQFGYGQRSGSPF